MKILINYNMSNVLELTYRNLTKIPDNLPNTLRYIFK